MRSVVGVGTNKERPGECVEEAVKDIRSPQIIFFFSGEKDFPEYARIIHRMFPQAVSIGCSTYRTWDPYGSQKDVLSVLAIEEGVICSGGCIPKVDNFALGYKDNVKRCLNQVEKTENTICVEFTSPFINSEEFTLMVLNSVLLRNEIPIIGGTSANIADDNGPSKEAYVALNGEVYSEGCVFALIHNCSGGISLYRENIYEPLTGKEFEVTKASSHLRTILTFDDDPALDLYARELGVPTSEADKYFFNYPMGRHIGNDTYITAIEATNSKGYMKFLARVQEGSKMMVLKEGDFKAITRKTIENILKKTEKPSLVLMFNCVARTLLFEQTGYLEEYQELMKKSFPQYIGFSCLGEQLGTKHFNHTLLLAVFE